MVGEGKSQRGRGRGSSSNKDVRRAKVLQRTQRGSEEKKVGKDRGVEGPRRRKWIDCWRLVFGWLPCRGTVEGLRSGEVAQARQLRESYGWEKCRGWSGANGR